VTRVAISPADPDEPDARDLIAEVAAELTRVTGHFTATSYAPADAYAPRSVFVIARDVDGGQRAVGCGAIRPVGLEHPAVAELKRMYARIPNFGPYAGSAAATCLGKRLLAI
jgi:hypothetical protein